MTQPGQSVTHDDSVERAFKWLCERLGADELAELLLVDREEILLWHRTRLPGELPFAIEHLIEHHAERIKNERNLR